MLRHVLVLLRKSPRESESWLSLTYDTVGGMTGNQSSTMSLPAPSSLDVRFSLISSCFIADAHRSDRMFFIRVWRLLFWIQRHDKSQETSECRISDCRSGP